jgi:hypothetical protein
VAARELEAAIKGGKWEPGEPVLNREKERTARRRLRRITDRKEKPRS